VTCFEEGLEMYIDRRTVLVTSLTAVGGIAVQSEGSTESSGVVSRRRVFVIGGPGNIGTSTLEVLLESGNEVGLYTLPESYSDEWAKKLKFYLGDRKDSETLKSAFDDFNPDYVVDFVLFHPEQARAILNLVCGRVEQYVFVSTVDVTGYPVARIPQRESDPEVPTTTEYAADKRACEKIFLSAFSPEEFPLTIVRPAYSLGAKFLMSFMTHDGGVYMIQRIRDERPVLVPGEGDGLFQPGNARNTGKMVARVIGRQKAVGKIYQCGHPELIRKDDYVRRIAGVVGREPVIVHVPVEPIVATRHPEVRRSLLPVQTRYHLAHSVQTFLEDYPDFRFQESVEDGVREYISYQEKQGNFADAGREIIDDKIIAAWLRCREHFHL